MEKILKILQEAGSRVCPMRWEDGTYYLLDQRRLPREETWLPCRSVGDIFSAIRDMVVRGAPAIGITAAFGMVLAAREGAEKGHADLREFLVSRGSYLKDARPTAVNLSWAVDRMLKAVLNEAHEDIPERAEAEALSIWEQDVRANIKMGLLGGELLPQSGGLLTHCNAGALATGGYGTALGVARGARKLKKGIQVFADETRPWLQGARLTAWELIKDDIPVVLNVDNASGYLMRTKKISCVVVGADRIAANGDVANKIGTYNVAVLARAHDIPFYVAAPVSTLDPGTPAGRDIPIEERDAEEITRFAGIQTAPEGTKAVNPVFDITPWEYVSAIITEKGVLKSPYEASIASVVSE